MSVPPTASTASFNEGNSCGKQAAPIKIPRGSEGVVAQFAALGKPSRGLLCGAQIRCPTDPRHRAPSSQRDFRNGFGKISSRLIGTDSHSSRSFLPRRSAAPVQFRGPSNVVSKVERRRRFRIQYDARCCSRLSQPEHIWLQNLSLRRRISRGAMSGRKRAIYSSTRMGNTKAKSSNPVISSLTGRPCMLGRRIQNPR